MKNRFLSMLIMSLSFAFSTLAIAGHHEESEAAKGPEFAAVELYNCEFNKGKSQKDLDKVIVDWNTWMDDSGAEPYSAWLLSPFYNSPDYSGDVLWLGAWPDGNAMGRGTDQYIADGGEIGAAFAKVMECGVHSNFASNQIMSGSSEASDNAVLTFSDCSIGKGTDFGDAMQANAAFAAYMAEQGSVQSSWAFWPVYGPEAEYDFKSVVAHRNHTELGADYHRYGTGGGFMKAGEIIGDKYDCGVSRVYNSVRVRDGAPTAE